MPLITKVKLKNGEIYELGKTWPVDDKEEGKRFGGFRIGLIRLCPAEGEEDDEGAISLPAHYEIWYVPPSLIENFFNPITRALFKHDPRELVAMVERQGLVAEDLTKFKIVHKRNIFISQVAYDSEDWPTLGALTEIRETVLDPTFGPDEADEVGDDQGPTSPGWSGDDGLGTAGETGVARPNGEQKSVEPVA